MNNIKTFAAAAVLAIATVSATSVMAKQDKMYCVDFAGQTASRATTKADCDKVNGTLVNEKDMEIRKDKAKEDKLAKDNKDKEDKMSKDDKAKEDKMKQDDKAKENKMK
jgi:hypothetical protein